MSNYFEENRKFLGLNGVLGRRDYIVNCILIEIFEALVYTTPLICLFLISPEMIKSYNSVGVSSGIFFYWTLILGVISSIFYFSSILRRTRDIVGTEDENKVNGIAGILTVLNFLGYLPFGPLGRFLSIFVLIYLAVQPGAITSSKPKSELIKFNWGAFFGTWMWGLFNRVPQTLFMIPLMFTFAGFPFMLLCGMKGNEWAYSRKKDEELEKFHEGQKNQTVLWLILAPVISFVLFILLFAFSSVATVKYAKSHPEFTQKFISALSDYQISAVDSVFEKIEVEDGEYKFYVEPEDWNELSENLMILDFKNAISYALIKEGKSFLSKTDFLDSVEIINRVKIYSTFNNEILAQYYMEPSEAQELSKLYLEHKKTSAEVREQFRKGYKFNTHPTLP